MKAYPLLQMVGLYGFFCIGKGQGRPSAWPFSEKQAERYLDPENMTMITTVMTKHSMIMRINGHRITE